MPIPLVVPDASVILKWVLPSNDEPNADQALALRDAIVDEHIRAIVPSLWLYEVGNTVARHFPDHATDWLAAMIEFGFEELPCSPGWLNTVLGLTRRYDVTFYDAAYHAVAIVHSGLFVTADTRYVSQAGDAGAVVTLSDWSRPGES